VKAGFFRTDFYGALHVGGSFSHVRGFIDGLRALGHECFTISSGPLSLGEQVRSYVVPYDPLYRNLPEVLSIAYNRHLQRAAAPIVRQERPQFLYHRHSEFNYTTALLKREFGVPLVLECNGSEVWIKKNWGKVYLEPLLRWAEEVQFETADVITVVSAVMKEQLTRLGVDAAKIVVNPNGVDIDAFRPGLDGGQTRATYGLEGKLVAGFVGTFGAWHGVDVLARSVKPAVARVPNIHFLIVGDGILRPEVERIIREDGVEDHVTLTGSVAHASIPAMLSACDILLSPHVQNADGTEFFGSPTKLFEYMGMGKPIIASGIGQIGEVLQDGTNALLMRHKDHDHLAECIERLAGDAGLRDRLGKKAREDAEARYSWRMNAKRVVDAVEPFVV
jgi:glycosyltransferase involved in cell wall biosynthesis